MRKPGEPRWTDLEDYLATLNQQQLMDLLKNLFERSDDNRSFLAIRLLPQGDHHAALERYRKRITAEFFPQRGFGKLRLGEARKAIREYRKLSADVVGTLDLMLTYVEQGTRFTNEYGDIDERFYNSLESVLQEFIKLLKTAAKGGEVYTLFEARVKRLARDAHGIGWGYGDNVTEWLDDLAQHMNP